MVQMTHCVEPSADVLMTMCWYRRLQLRRWWHCQQVSGPCQSTNATAAAVRMLMILSKHVRHRTLSLPLDEEDGVDDVIHVSRSWMFRSSSKYIYTAASCLVAPHWAATADGDWVNLSDPEHPQYKDRGLHPLHQFFYVCVCAYMWAKCADEYIRNVKEL